MIQRAFARRTVGVVVVAFLAGGCDGDSPADASRRAASLTAQTPLLLEAAAGARIEGGVAVLVQDRAGQPVAGVPVTFTVPPGSGKVERSTARTNSEGLASSGAWTLAETTGEHRLRARVARVDSVEFVVAVAPGVPVSAGMRTVAVASATVATLVQTPPSVVVRDQFSNPIAGVRVSFALRGGDGELTGTEPLTNSRGAATVGSWKLGTRSGRQELVARVEGLPEVVLAVNAVAGPAEVMRLVAGSDQIAVVGQPLEVAPKLSIRDAYDNPVVGRVVRARVVQGEGLLGAEVITDSTGHAAVSRWSMGLSEGLNAVAVDVDGLSPLTIYAKAVPASTFDIQFRYLTPVTDRQRASFERAAARWRKVIIGDLMDIQSVRSSYCGLAGSALNEIVDDIIIFVQLEPIDGAGKVLGSAGPCSVRSANGLTHVGAMRFDTDDVAEMEANGRFDAVVLHEIGHILGIGTLWSYHNLLVDAGGADPHYTGESGRAGFATAGGALYTGTPVPVENSGGPGTRDGHWRESILNAEVMTGFVEAPGVRMPLSLLTIGSLEDMGYQISIWGDDAYTYLGAPLLSGAVPRRPAAPDRELIEVPFPPPEVVTASGQSSPISASIARPAARQRRMPRALPRPVQQVEVRRGG